jgi:hypothetical protein
MSLLRRLEQKLGRDTKKPTKSAETKGQIEDEVIQDEGESPFVFLKQEKARRERQEEIDRQVAIQQEQDKQRVNDEKRNKAVSAENREFLRAYEACKPLELLNIIFHFLDALEKNIGSLQLACCFQSYESRNTDRGYSTLRYPGFSNDISTILSEISIQGFEDSSNLFTIIKSAGNKYTGDGYGELLVQIALEIEMDSRVSLVADYGSDEITYNGIRLSITKSGLSINGRKVKSQKEVINLLTQIELSGAYTDLRTN